MIDILNRYTGAVLYHDEAAQTMTDAVLSAVKSRAYLRGANLSGAYLSRAYLSGADLSGADLSRADLSRAYLSGADLSGAYLSGADLSGADLSGADLSRADLSGAYLSRADLRGAYLSDAILPDGMHIIQVLGSSHGIVALATSEGVELRIGCHHKPLAEWQKHYKAIGRANGYTPAQIREYGAHITYIAWWAKHLPKEK